MSQSLLTPLLVTLPVSRTNRRFNMSTLHHRPFPHYHHSLSHPIRCSISLPSLDSGIRKGASDFLDVELLVRDCELDEYDVVNNVVYASYCQHARQELLNKVGIDTNAIARTGEAMAISDMTFKFCAPLRSGDSFVVSVRITNKSGARLIAEHLIYKLPNRELVLEAKASVLWLNKNYSPVRIPSEIRSKLTEFRRHDYPD